MCIGLLALKTLNFYVMLGVIFLMSVQSAVFGPAKYSSLPEILPNHKLSWGNGIFSLGTFFGIIAGGTAAGFLSNSYPTSQVLYVLIDFPLHQCCTDTHTRTHTPNCI